MHFSRHAANDWCHLCGRREWPTLDVWYPANAEHDGPTTARYLRVCSLCLDELSNALKLEIKGK